VASSFSFLFSFLFLFLYLSFFLDFKVNPDLETSRALDACEGGRLFVLHVCVWGGRGREIAGGDRRITKERMGEDR